MKRVEDRKAFEASIAQLTALELQHLVPSHGEVYSSNARSGLLAALKERGLPA